MRRLAAAVAIFVASAPVSAQFNELLILTQVPTLDEIGLGVLIGLVGAAAGWSIGRRNRRK